MRLRGDLINELRVEPGKPADLVNRSTSRTRTDWLGPLGHAHPKELADRDLEAFKSDLSAAQEVLYASARWALLIIFQALDAAGKDGTIKHVMSGVNPQGCRVATFKAPSPGELEHDFLWRCSQDLPARGHIGIFNRSYYEEVLVVRVHPQLLMGEHLPPNATSGHGLWQQRYEDINAFERHLDRNGTRILKFFLNVSKEEQRHRFLERLDDPAKQWKFSAADLAERDHFDDYQRAYEDALTATSTPWAPWYVVPADHKHQLRALVGGIVVHAIGELDLALPEPDAEQLAAIRAAKESLEADRGD